jgi:hypothetical protein
MFFNSLIRNSSEVVNGVPSTKWLKLAEVILNFPKPLSDYATFADVLLPILDDDNIANIFAQKRQKLHSQIMVSENLILLQLASAILWMGLH